MRLPRLSGKTLGVRAIMRNLFLLLTLLPVACGGTTGQCSDTTLISRVASKQEARTLVLHELDLSTLPDERRRSMEAWVDEELDSLFAPSVRGQIWYFKEPKGGLGSRKGLVVVEECRRVAEFEFSDDN